ncbi:hypothetical protein MNBD_GAMMA16-2204, partial [hydrothermal vent metagenome]
TPESAVAAEMSRICSRLDALGSLTSDQAQLRSACTELGNASNDFDERVTGLVAISAKTATAQWTTATRTSLGDQGNLLVQRLSALRKGLDMQSLSGLSLYINDRQLVGSSSNRITGGSAGALGSEDETKKEMSDFGFYVKNSIAISEQKTGNNLAGFEANAFSLLGGGDYRYKDEAVAGVAFNYTRNDLDLAQGQGELEGNGYGLVAYGSYFPAPAWFLDGSVHLGSGSYDLSRNINFTVNSLQFNEVANSSTDVSQLGLAFGGGYDILLEQGGQIELGGQFSYTTSEIDGYRESGAGGFNLNISSQEIKQTRITLSAQFSQAISTSRGVFIPMVRGAFVTDLSADEQTISADFVSDPGSASFSFVTPSRDSTYLELAFGGSFYFVNGAAVFVQLETLQFIDDYEQLSFSLGYRQEL